MVDSHQRLLMAMPLHDHRVTQLRRCEIRRLANQKLVKHQRMRGKIGRPLIVRKERRQFVAKSQDTTRLEPDDRDSRSPKRIENVHDRAKPPLSTRNHTLLLKRTPATQIAEMT